MSEMPPKGPSKRSLYRTEFCARVRKLREGKHWTQVEMAEAMGIDVNTWRKYETRSPLPHDLVERFALIVERSVSYIMTGKETGKELSDVAGHGRPFKKAL